MCANVVPQNRIYYWQKLWLARPCIVLVVHSRQYTEVQARKGFMHILQALCWS